MTVVLYFTSNLPSARISWGRTGTFLKRGLLSNVSKYVGSLNYNCKDTITGESQVMSRSHEYRCRDENKQTNKQNIKRTNVLGTLIETFEPLLSRMFWVIELIEITKSIK